MRSLSGFSTGCVASICESSELRHNATRSKAMSNTIEQVAAGALLVVFLAGFVAVAIGFVVLCDRIKDWFLGVPRLSKKQLDRIAMWRLRQIGEGRMDFHTACRVIPSEADLLASEAAWVQEVEQAKREIAAKKKADQAAHPEVTPPEQVPMKTPPRVIFELIADRKFKLNLGTVSDAFREVIADHRKILCELVRDRRFAQVIEHFRREEQRTHNAMRCACFVMKALFDSLKEVRVTGQLVGKVTPERGENGGTAYRNTFFMQDFSGANRRPLQASDLMPAESIESSPAQNEAEPPEIIFEDGKAVIRPHTTSLMPVSTFRLTFQDGEEMDISSDLEFAGLDEEEFRIAYDAFERTRADLFGKTRAPELNSKEQRDLDSGQN